MSSIFALRSRSEGSNPRAEPPRSEPEAHARTLFESLPLAFEPNVGQFIGQMDFVARSATGTVLLDRTGAMVVVPSQPHDRAIKLTFEGGTSPGAADPQERLSGVINYFQGSDPAAWRRQIPTYGRVAYRGIYPGVDVVFYGNGRRLEYDLVVAPGASVDGILLAFEGHDGLEVGADGSLVLKVGDERLEQLAPFAYQEQADGTREEVQAKLLIASRDRVRISVGEYDRTRPLVIDPVLVYSTMLGSTGADQINGIAVDGNGFAYVAGQAGNNTFPSTAGSYQPAPLTNAAHAFVTKLKADGTGLVYSTYLSGSSTDVATDIAIDSSGNAYVTGRTNSTNFPVTSGVIQPSHAPVTSPTTDGADLFVTKLSPDGSALVFSTYLGGSGAEDSGAIAVDPAGNVFIAAQSASADFVTTSGAYQPSKRGGNTYSDQDLVLVKLNPTATARLYSTFIGGSAYDSAARSVAIDAAGNASVTGWTTSTDFPTVNARQTTAGGGYEAFVAKLNPAGSALVFSTYLGGNGDDIGKGIDVDASGNVYVVGETRSGTFPVTPGAYQTAFSSSHEEGFVTKLSADGSTLVFSTLLGGGGPDSATGVRVDVDGSALVIGDTYGQMPSTARSFQAACTNSSAFSVRDAFLVKLAPSGSHLAYASCHGAGSGELANDVALDSAGDVYFVGNTTGTVPTTATAYQRTSRGGADGYVVRVSLPLELAKVTPNQGGSSGGRVISLLGNKFQPDATVTFDGVAATAVTYVSPNQLTVTTPAHAPGAVAVTVNSGGDSVTMANGFTYTPVPVVSSIDVTSGPAKGGTQVLITGSNFDSNAQVDFGGAIATRNWGTSTQIGVTTTVHPGGLVNVSVINSDQGTGTLPNAFTYIPAPVVTSITPNVGRYSGGDAVTIIGANFDPGATVEISSPLTNMVIESSTRITGVTPNFGVYGALTVIVTNPDGQTGTLPGGFQSLWKPLLYNAIPNYGPLPGGNTITLTGAFFRPGSKVFFSGVESPGVTYVSEAELKVVVPAHAAGSVTLTVTTPENQTSDPRTNAYRFNAPPVLSSVVPAQGPIKGGTTVHISASDTNGARVYFGDVEATEVSNWSTTGFDVTTPEHAKGLVDVVITNYDGQSARLPGAFTFEGPPTLVSVSPDSGSVKGGTKVKVRGGDFRDGVIVRFGGRKATSINRVSDSEIQAVTPEYVGDATVDVRVSNVDGQASSLSRAFSFGDGSALPGEESDSGCGCASTSSPHWVWAVLVVLALRLGRSARKSHWRVP